MERTKGRVLRRCCVAALALFVVSLACLAWAGVYNKCRVPPIVASVEKPNVMMLIDFSGSMQYAPYYGYDGRTWAYYYSTGVIDQYDETYQPDGGGPAICRYDKYRDYYGFFDPGGYYRYNSTGDYFEVFTPTGTVGTSVRTYTIKEIKIDIQDYSDAGGAKIYRAYFKYALASGGTAIAVDECVFLRDVDKQSALLSNKAFRVIAVGTVGTDNYFAVYFTPSRDGDPPTTDYIACAGSATTRVTGNFTNGISGNFLNFAAMSRMDNTLTALIGGKAQCNTETECATSDDTCHCYIRGQGGRRNARDTTALHVDVYTRAGDYTSASDWRPNNYNTGNSYKDKYSFLSVSTHNHGTLTPADPISFKGDGQAELWTFTMSRQTRIFIEMRKDVVDSKKARIRLYNGSTPAGDPLGTWTANGVFNPNDAEISNGSTRTARDNGYLLNAGTYCVEATCETALAGSDTLGYTLVINADVTKSTHAAHDGETRSTTGAFTAGRVVLKKDKALRSGIIQDTFGRVRYGFAYFQGSTQGKIVVGCDNTDQDALVDALQSNTTATSTLYPYGGTPTGEAMWEMYKYYKQESSVDGRSYVNNGAFISKGGSVDPYYSSGSLTPCRRSFVLLISDGAWNGSQDPVVPAYRMHINDIRTDSGLSGTQSVNVYTVYTYSTDQLGQNSMKEIAMYGGFQDLPDSAGVKDNYPYTANRGTALPSTSLNLDWPLKGCSKCVTGSWCTSACLKNCCPLAHECPSAGGACQTYTCSGSSKFFDPSWAGPNGTYSTQCAEWAFETMQQMPPDPSNPVYTDGNAKRTIYGEPRTYFYSSSGTEISDALTRIIGEIESAHAAAGAVATVSQEIRGFDIVLRGVFQAVDETDPARSVWYGHLEAYSPYADGTYSFEKCCNEDKLCYQDSGSACDGEDCPSARNCWDAAQILTSTTRGRIFAGYDLNSNGKIERNEVKDFTTANASYFRPLLNLQAANDCDHNGTLNNTDAAELISWIRGNASTCYRSRIDTVDTSKTWLMGDVAYSTPVIVGVPSLGAVSRMDPNITEYLTFRNNQLSKQETPPSGVNTASPTLAQVMKKVVYVGANDGQLHAFVFGVWDWRNQKWVYEYNSSDAYGKYIGQELWAYIPSNLVSELKDLAAISYGNTGCKHRTMVDLSPQAWH
ncbi:MAG: hypothetical protein FJ118_06555, partial [Deltaproteobacteria bacterium]|nr:hypothetical protein [Deltaproteobacteria bacterium]